MFTVGRWGSALVVLFLGFTLMFPKAASPGVSVHLPLRPAADTERAKAVRTELFGVDPAQTNTELAIEVKVARNDDRDDRGRVSARGDLIIGSKQYPVEFQGELEVQRAEDGGHFFFGPVHGTLRVDGKQCDVTFGFFTVPEDNNYVVSMTINPPDGGLTALAFGEDFPEYKRLREALKKAYQEGDG